MITKLMAKVCLALALLAVTGCGIVDTAKQANQTGVDFMTALKEGNFDAAYALLTQELQAEVGEVGNLQKMIDDNSARPKEWAFSSWNMSTDPDQNSTATVEGSVTYQDGREGVVKLVLLKVGDSWQLLSFDLNW